MDKKKIVVTGGTGFIGSHTVIELLASGYQPIIVDNFDNSFASVLDGIKRITSVDTPFYEVDCRNEKALSEVFDKEGDIYGVIHFAANKAVGESAQNPLKYYDNNIQSLIVLLKVMQAKKVHRLVFSSSCTVYGVPSRLPVDENSAKAVAASPYGNTKIICEDILNDYVHSKKEFGVISLRYFNPVGAHPSSFIGELPIGVPNNLLPFITQTAAGIRKELVVFGNDYDTPDGTCIRDYIHVVDLAKAHVKSLDLFAQKDIAGTNEIFNLGTGKGNSVLEAINSFEKVSGLKLNYKFGPRRDGDVPVVYGDVTKANKVLGWKCEFNLDDSMRDSWNWQLTLGTKK